MAEAIIKARTISIILEVTPLRRLLFLRLIKAITEMIITGEVGRMNLPRDTIRIHAVTTMAGLRTKITDIAGIYLSIYLSPYIYFSSIIGSIFAASRDSARITSPHP